MTNISKTSSAFFALTMNSAQTWVIEKVCEIIYRSLFKVFSEAEKIEGKLDVIQKGQYHQRASHFFEARDDMKAARNYERDNNHKQRDYYLREAVHHFRGAYHKLMDDKEREKKLKIYSLFLSGICSG